jgi:hypothetical protein
VEPNSARWPTYRRVDMTFKREFPLRFGKLRFRMEIRNLFNRRNVLTGYYLTGSPTNPGTSSWYSYSSSYWDSRNNNNFALSRLLYFGLEMLF